MLISGHSWEMQHCETRDDGHGWKGEMGSVEQPGRHVTGRRISQ